MYTKLLGMALPVLKRLAVDAAHRVVGMGAGYASVKASHGAISMLRNSGVPVSDNTAAWVSEASAMLGSYLADRAVFGRPIVCSAPAEDRHSATVPTPQARFPGVPGATVPRAQTRVTAPERVHVPSTALAEVPMWKPPAPTPPPPMPSFLDMNRLRPTNAYQGPEPLVNAPPVQYGNPPVQYIDPRPPIQYGSN